MWRTSSTFVALAVLTVLQMPGASAAELPDAIARCADIADNLERLTCYDRQNPPGRAVAAPASPAADFGANEELKRKRQAAAGETAVTRAPDRITAKVKKVSATTGGLRCPPLPPRSFPRRSRAARTLRTTWSASPAVTDRTRPAARLPPLPRRPRTRC